MKSKNTKKSKLTLSKQTIVNLDNREMTNVKAGAVTTIIIGAIIDILLDPDDANQSADLVCASIDSCASDCAICS